MIASTGSRAAGRPTRRYRSPGRQEQGRRTRARIITAAARRFAVHGYTATTMRAVATDAEVSLPGVELAFGTKACLLKAVIDVAIAGDDESVPMLARDWSSRAQATTDPAAFAAVFAQVLTKSAQRAAALTLVALEAARLDDDIAAIAGQLMRQRRVMATWLVDGLTDRSPLRAEISRSTAIDTVWTLMDPAVFCRLTGERRWSAARFRHWFADSILRLLLPAVEHPTTRDRAHTRGGGGAG